MSNVVELATRKPTGRPSWPIVLVAGVEKSGKSYSCAEASASDLIHRTLWVGVGEDAPDELGALPGARFEIVEHDGTYRGILAALTACAAQPSKDGRPNLVILDSATRLWDLLCDEQQVVANDRARRKAERFKRPVPDEDATITMDQWNTAKQRWTHVMDTLRSHQGPSLVTARLENVVVVKDGQPTTDREFKVKAEKSLPYDVGAIVEMPARGDTYLAGVRSLRFKPAETGRTKYPDFTVDKLWRDLGLAEKDGVGERHHVSNDPADKPAQDAASARAELGKLADAEQWNRDELAAQFVKDYDLDIKVASAGLVREFIDRLKTAAAKSGDAA